MEQVIAAIHSLRNTPGNFKEKYIDGEVTRWFSLEMVSFGGEIHFYIRCPEQFKTLVQAPLFSYYPDVEIAEVEDYMDELPSTTAEMYGRDSDLWGTEMILVKDGVYPIKTYTSFESDIEENSLDPIGALIEVLAKMKMEEFAAIHLVIVPKGREWRDEVMGEINKIREGESKPKTAKLKTEFPEGGPLPLFTGGEAKEGEPKPLTFPTPGTTDILKAVETNLSKAAFDTIIRVGYMGPTAAFYESFVRSGVTASFNQYSAMNLNAFKPNSQATTKVSPYKWPYTFVKARTEYRKQRFLYNFIHRQIPEQNPVGTFLTSYLLNFNNASQFAVLTTESLATLFHIPTQAVVTAPHIKRVESRKVGPPAGMAIFGEDKEIGRFE